MKVITTLYAWIATEANGEEGLPAVSMRIGAADYLVPLVGADIERIESMLREVQLVRAQAGVKRVRLARFELVEDKLQEL